MKRLVYRIGKNSFISFLLWLMYPFFKIKFDKFTKSKTSIRQPFEICITVDTEPGYIKEDYTREWMFEGNDNPIGYTAGIKHLLQLADKYDIKLTFLLCTKALMYKEKEDIINLLKKAYKSGHEIGLHHHPRRNPLIGGKYESSKFYKIEEIRKNLRKEKALVKKYLGKEIVNNLISFRWGNWALFKHAAVALEKEGFRIDSSAVPGIKGHTKDDRIYDWSDEKRRFPWILDNSKVVEIPIATFTMFGIKFKADPALNSQILINCFKKYYNNLIIRSKTFKFVVITHSNEMVMKDGSPSHVFKNLEKFVKYVKMYDVKFNTLASLH